MPLQNTSGNDSADAYGGGKAVVPNYIEQVFSTYVYSGNSSTQSIVNGIDLAGKGGLTWIKVRDFTYNNYLYDTVRGVSNALYSNTTNAQASSSNFNSFDSTGFTLNSSGGLNNSSYNYASWTFRKQPKFFDIVTYMGTGSAMNIAHSLGSTPGCIIIKPTSDATFNDWRVWHQNLTSQSYQLKLNTTDAQANVGNFDSQNSTSFSISGTAVVQSGISYVAYLFASNAGGFGLTGTDNVITCGSFTGASSVTVNLGYEPQWILAKLSTGSSNWYIFDVMRGMSYNQGNQLKPDSPSAESDIGQVFTPTATGFTYNGNNLYASGTLIYIAIRRGPMAVPTDATKVFSLATAVSTNPAFVSNSVVDMGFNTAVNAGSLFFNQSRLTDQDYLNTRSTAAAGSDASRSWDYMNGMLSGQSTNTNNVAWMFGRAPSFFDEVCYTGTGSATTQAHNLGVVPELMIVKCRSTGGTNRGWWTYVAPLGNTQALYLNTSDNAQTAGIWNNTTPTSTVFSIDGTYLVNGSGATYVAYLFATCAGVSKVGSYTGNGSTQAISCGFTGGARFVLIKQTDSTGDWYLYDTLRGMTTLTDPYVLVNSAAAQTATLGSVTTTTGGFTVNSAILAAINTSSATYIFLAIA